MQRRSAMLARFSALLLLASVMLPASARAQDASPVASPAALGAKITSKTCAEEKAEWQEAFAATDEPPAFTDGTYVEGTTSDLQSVNPFLANSDPSISIVALIFDPLFSGDPRTGEPSACGLTDYYEIAPDGVTYTFHLNTQAKWQDGVDLTSADVIFSMDALADPATQSSYTGTFLSTIKSWRAIDDDTVEVVANEPRFTVLYDLLGLEVVPKHIWENIPRDQWATSPAATGQDPSQVVGTGPFKFVGWQQGQEIDLTRNDDYYDQDLKPKFKDYIFRIFPDSESQLNAFLNGEIDTISLEPQQVDTVKNTDGVQWAAYPGRGFQYYEFNMDPTVTTFFQDARVRQAFMWALDRQSIVDNIELGFGEVANGTQPSVSPAYAPDQMTTTYTYDPDKAKQLLTDAGWTDTNGNGIVDKDGQEMSFDFIYPSGSTVDDTLVAYFQDAWKAVGIDIHPKTLEFSEMNQETTITPTYSMALYGFSWDASFTQDPMFACDQFQVGFNDMKYCNPQLDQIFAQIKTTFDPVKRRDLMIQAANIVNDDQPIGVIYFDQGIAGWNNRVHNYHPGTWGNQSYVGVWVDQ
jgi:peptide/nickel transport system substrate-binding protein